jgi:hypothetical protein
MRSARLRIRGITETRSSFSFVCESQTAGLDQSLLGDKHASMLHFQLNAGLNPRRVTSALRRPPWDFLCLMKVGLVHRTFPRKAIENQSLVDRIYRLQSIGCLPRTVCTKTWFERT